MTYQELVNCYPWIDLVLELFKGIMPTIVALLAIFLNNHFSKKRDLMFRKKNLKLDYFVKILNWLHEIKNDYMNVSLVLENALNKADPNERAKRFNDFLKSISSMNGHIASWKETYSVLLESYNCDIKFNQFKQEIVDYSNELVDIGKRSINQADTTVATDEINMIAIKMNEVINERIRLLLAEINSLY